jgi:hypothetical protein
MKKGERWTENGATDHVLIELDTACHDAYGARSNFALCERAGCGGPGRVPRDRDDDEGRTVSDMKMSYVTRGRRYAATVRCRNERVFGRREYGGEGGEEVNSNKSELNRK